ncbi:MAG: hypothetical protein HQL77_17815 [Magnetococcales bacterium]|nr:hypothetical protein [Magnetococcales bacterium]
MKESIKIDLAGYWKAYADHIPASCKVMGTVTRDGTIGALVKSGNGSYAQFIAGISYALDKNEVEAAMGTIYKSYGISPTSTRRTSNSKPGTPYSGNSR